MKKKVYIPIGIVIVAICLSFTVSETNADPIWEIHYDVYTIDICLTHGYPDWMSVQWYCAYSKTKEKHKDGHETAIESYEIDWMASWKSCGNSPSEICGYQLTSV